MTLEFKLPDLGENIESGEVVAVLVAVGDTIEEDQPVIELETDKAVIEVPSSVSGTIQTIHVNAGDQAAVGQILLTLAASDAASAAAPEAAPEPAPEPVPPEPAPVAEAPAGAAQLIEFKLPDLGENIEGGDVVEVLVAVGDRVEADQPVVELETDKAVIPVPAPQAGLVKEIHVNAGDHVQVNQLLLTIESAGTVAAAAPAAVPAAPTTTAPVSLPAPSPAAAPEPAAAAPTPTPVSQATPGNLVPAAPSVRRLAREIGVDIAQVPGNGPGGRISKDDVKAYARKLNTERPVSTTGGAPIEAPPLPDFSQWGQTESQSMSNVRRITAERLTYAFTTIPQVTQFDKADTTDLEKLRKQYGPRAEAAGGKLTPTAIIIKVLATALKVFPQFNASIDMAQRQVIYKKYCNIGIAVDTDRGLLVPVVRNADQKNLIELSVELSEIAQKARNRKITPEDMQGGCMTISNVGVMGGTAFTPIVNPPEVAILGIARTQTEAVYIDGQFQPRQMMPLSLSYDHRQIDGADGARFLRWICEALENPFILTLEG
jgi:pyruvate dehydrogenase E2 component (dihydrolipoamide acetyltransferase)